MPNEIDDPEIKRKPIFSKEKIAAQEKEGEEYKSVTDRYSNLLETLSSRSDLPEEWKQSLSNQEPAFRALLELMYTPDIQWNGKNFLTLVQNYTPDNKT